MKDIEVPQGTKIVVCGDIHGHEKQFMELIEQIQPSEKMWFVSVGDILDKGFGRKSENIIINKIKELHEKGLAHIVKGNHELKHIRLHRREGKKLYPELDWMDKQPLSLFFRFNNGSRLTVIHAGVTVSHTWEDSENNSEIVYIRELDEDGQYIPLKWKKLSDGRKQLQPKKEGKPWHEFYDGRFGYIASGHNAQVDGIPKFFKHSCNLDSACYNSGVLTAQIFSETGREELIQTRGEAANAGIDFREKFPSS